jgi:hypothetical protein
VVSSSRREYVLVTYAVLPCSVKRTGATWGISGDVCCVFCRYANHIYVSHTARTNYGDECDLPPIIHMPSIFGKAFLLVRSI